MSSDPFEDLDMQRELETANWTVTAMMHTPTLDAHLNEERTRLTLQFASGHQETLGRQDIEALARFLSENAQVGPLIVDESVLKDIHPTRVE
jgi:CRISPR/Cas system-associated protein Csm6